MGAPCSNYLYDAQPRIVKGRDFVFAYLLRKFDTKALPNVQQGRQHPRMPPSLSRIPQGAKPEAAPVILDYQSPKLMPSALASLTMEALGSTIFSLPATSSRGTFTISRFL